ncbi:HNH endonuclease signature motif containing protein [Klenkia sp. PcliD-1-E]|uniref:HNH endonuclease signature motif containing protein n=1 Tax=Klenkia sp. PcliD-1-E TaxID=2954492 RepID=UPI0020976D0D|nr:HNH endonuclease signature motif containing protein [Klenkia sp. PcliD-1-E]MCO7220942.1 HNH endonuclease [Klenkia sp. PcliD-1-E]
MGELTDGAPFDLVPDSGMFSAPRPSAVTAAWAALDAEVAATRAAEEAARPQREKAARAADRETARQLSMTVPDDVAAVLAAAREVVEAVVPCGGPGVVAPALLARVRGLQQLADVVDTALAHAVRAAENAQAAEFDGQKSMRAWMPGHLGTSPATAARVVRAGRTLAQLPRWDAAAAEGRVTADQTATVAKVATPARLAAAAELGVDLHGDDGLDATLTACATGPAPEALPAMVQRTLDWIDPDGPEPDPTRRRELHLSSDADGSGGSAHGRWDAVGFEKVLTALTACQQAGRVKDDDRSHAQQMADALVQLCDNALAAATTPVLRGNRAHVTVTVDAEDLLDTDEVSGAARLGSGQQVANTTARQIACDSIITRVLFGPDGMPLNIGRSQRLVPAHIRRAAEARDGGCVFAGCSNPSWWCDAHHVAEWIADHGETSVENTALLCERHHTKVHHGYSVQWDPDRRRWRTSREDGTEITTGYPVPDGA